MTKQEKLLLGLVYDGVIKANDKFETKLGVSDMRSDDERTEACYDLVVAVLYDEEQEFVDNIADYFYKNAVKNIPPAFRVTGMFDAVLEDEEVEEDESIFEKIIDDAFMQAQTEFYDELDLSMLDAFKQGGLIAIKKDMRQNPENFVDAFSVVFKKILIVSTGNVVESLEVKGKVDDEFIQKLKRGMTDE